MLYSICQQIWKTQQWPQDWKRSVFIPIPKKGSAKEILNYWINVLISHASKVMLKILQVRLQQYVNQELLGVQARFRKGRETRLSQGSWPSQSAPLLHLCGLGSLLGILELSKQCENFFGLIVLQFVCHLPSGSTVGLMDNKKGWAPKNWSLQTVVWTRLLRVPWTARRSNQSILKEINPEYSVEGLMLKLMLQYFDHLMWRADTGKDPDVGKDWRQE